MANTGLLDPEFDVRVRALAAAAREAGYNPQMTSGFRGPGEQARAIDSVSRNVNGRPASIMDFARGIPGYAAPVGGSQHEKGTAVDWGTGPALDWMRQNAPRYGVEFPKSLARTDPIHSQVDSKFYGPVQDPRDRGVVDGGPPQPTATAGRAAAPIASQGRQQMTEPTGFGGLLSNFASGLQSGMQSPLFQSGLATFNAGANGTNWGGALMAGGEAANKASQAQLAQTKAQREMAQQKLRDQMMKDIGSGHAPAWAKDLPQGVLALAPVMGADAWTSMVAQMLVKTAAKNADRDLDERKLNSQEDLNKAHADYYRARARPADVQPVAAPAAIPDPLQNAGIDDAGNIVMGGSKQPASPYGPGSGDTWQLPQQRPFPEPMRLGGPVEDRIRPDPSQDIRVAQASGPTPTLMDQAKARMFGPAGVTSPEVPGIITDAGRNRRTDVPATREAQGQKAIDQATPEQQDRLKRFREEQERWSWVYKRQPRAGHYYDPSGRELPLSDKNFKGDKEMQAQAILNMQKITQASKVLLETPYPVQAVAGYMNAGETGQALADMKQAALGIAYALSGKTVAVAEMKNFIDAYGPTPYDTNARIRAKTERMQQFYGALLSATRGGEDYDKAFAKAMAVMGVKNPDGTPAGAPAAASAGKKPPPDLSKESTEDLLRRLNGGR